MEEAMYLTHFADKVHVIHRRDKLRASKIMQDRAFDNPKIEMVWNKVVSSIEGVEDKRVTGVTLVDTVDGRITTLPVSGVFVAIGHRPNSDLFVGQLEMDDCGYLMTHHNVRTNVPGVYACGDVQDDEYRQAVTAAGSGCMAAIEAERLLAIEDTGAIVEW